MGNTSGTSFWIPEIHLTDPMMTEVDGQHPVFARVAEGHRIALKGFADAEDAALVKNLSLRLHLTDAIAGSMLHELWGQSYGVKSYGVRHEY